MIDPEIVASRRRTPIEIDCRFTRLRPANGVAGRDGLKSLREVWFNAVHNPRKRQQKPEYLY